MTKTITALLLALGCLAAQADDAVQALLRTADSYRTGSEKLQVETLAQVFHRDGRLDKERRYTVFVQGDRRSLVLMRSPAEAGQKVLMLGDDFWLLLPGSQRPVRITPTQKLLGDASTGDIATLSWSQDYRGQRVGEGPCPAPDEARHCIQLSLQAVRKGVSYQRIELWLGSKRHEPVAADLYVQSDKLAKQARFVMGQGQPTQVEQMLLRDRLSNQKETRISYLGRTPRSVPEAWLNPMFLARNPALETSP